MYRREQRRRNAQAKAAPLDLAMLSIAIWLGLAVTVSGLIRLAQTMPATTADAIVPATMAWTR